MLNLELLEQKLDEVLSKETSETMTSWLMNKRLKKYISLLGEGNFISMPKNKISMSQSRSFTVDTEINEYSTEYTCDNTDDDYLLAA